MSVSRQWIRLQRVALFNGLIAFILLYVDQQQVPDLQCLGHGLGLGSSGIIFVGSAMGLRSTVLYWSFSFATCSFFLQM